MHGFIDVIMLRNRFLTIHIMNHYDIMAVMHIIIYSIGDILCMEGNKYIYLVL